MRNNKYTEKREIPEAAQGISIYKSILYLYVSTNNIIVYQRDD